MDHIQYEKFPGVKTMGVNIPTMAIRHQKVALATLHIFNTTYNTTQFYLYYFYMTFIINITLLLTYNTTQHIFVILLETWCITTWNSS